MERRLAAVLVADVVGYSRLMEADEAGTLLAMKTRREGVLEPVINAHGGRIVKLMGDGVLAEFGSAVNAVRSAIDLQSRLAEANEGPAKDKSIVWRIGISLGDVVSEGSDIYGEGVNVAARLENLAEAGGICVSANIHDQVRGKIGAALEDMGEQTLKNIERPLRVYKIQPGNTPSATGPKLPDKPSIAVLPFQNFSDDASQEYFADGMVEDIVTGLSRIKWLFVIARNSSFVYKGKAVDVRQVGKQLGVRYILEGSLRKFGNRLRVTAQLVEAETGAHLWAEKYDGTIEDVFDFQDTITERVVGIVEPSVRKSEIERSRQKRPESLGAYDLFLRAMPHLQARMPDEARVAIPLLENALDLDPQYHAARANLAWCYEWCFTRGGLNEKDRTEALRHARSALASDTDDAAALAIAGWVVIVLTKESAMAAEAIDRALTINPSCATAHYFAALVNSFAGRASPAAHHAERALRLSPLDPSAFEAYLALGFSAVGEGHFNEAAEHFATASRVNPRHSLFPFCHAIALALAGRLKEGELLAKRGLELEPGFRIRIFSEFGMSLSLSEKFTEGARNARLAGMSVATTFDLAFDPFPISFNSVPVHDVSPGCCTGSTATEAQGSTASQRSQEQSASLCVS